MKPLIWASLLASSVAGAAPECLHTSREHYVSGWEEAASIERIYRPISAQGAIDCAFFPDPENRLNVLVRYEHGSVNGIGYRVHYADGSALIQGNGGIPFANADYADNWKLACRPSAHGQAYHCTLGKGDLRVEKDAQGTPRLAIGEHHRKGSGLLLRVDTNWAVTAPVATGFSAGQTTQLLNQMRAGKKADTGYHDASLQGRTEKPLSLFGFAQALDIMDEVLEQLNNPPADGH